MAAVLGNSESQAISDVEIARDDPEAEKTTAAPQSGKNWSNPRSPNGNAQVQPAKFTGWFGNAKKIPLAPTDENYKEKSASLIAAGFSFSDEEELWVRP